MPGDKPNGTDSFKLDWPFEMNFTALWENVNITALLKAIERKGELLKDMQNIMQNITALLKNMNHTVLLLDANRTSSLPKDANHESLLEDVDFKSLLTHYLEYLLKYIPHSMLIECEKTGWTDCPNCLDIRDPELVSCSDAKPRLYFHPQEKCIEFSYGGCERSYNTREESYNIFMSVASCLLESCNK